MARTYGIAMVLGAALVASGCDSEVVSYDNLRIYESPYRDVEWSTAVRLKAQHHDHIGVRTNRIAAYDQAGYDVLSLMDYSGNATLPHALGHRLWPPEDWIPPSILSTLVNVKFFIPNAEETGVDQHATSPFLTGYIEGGREPSGEKPSWKYDSIDEMFSIVRAQGGFPCLAHPWSFPYERIEGSFCVEIYTAYSAAKAGRAGAEGERNELLLDRWDKALERNQRIWGIAVNDHYGPYLTFGTVAEEVRDSGKIVVLSRAATLDAYREAFVRGAILAVRDQGTLKDRYPEIRSIEVGDTYAHIEAHGDVRWVTRGATVSSGPTLEYADLPPNVRYVRAEVEGGGSTVYTQAFVVRPVGDVDADYDIDARDQEICTYEALSALESASCLAAVETAE